MNSVKWQDIKSTYIISVVCIYINNELFEKEIKKTIPFKTAPKK